MNSLKNFNPNNVGQAENTVFGLPFQEADAELIILPVPWEATVSYGKGTSKALAQVDEASRQVDLLDIEYGDAWQKGIFMRPIAEKIYKQSVAQATLASKQIKALEKGVNVFKHKVLKESLKKINDSCKKMNDWVYQESSSILSQNKKMILLGGDHSTPYGYYQALAERHNNFGILHLDAHCDLRNAYENFTYSHASVMFNALEHLPQIKKLIQVGIRDYCHEEAAYIAENSDRISVYFDKDIQYEKIKGKLWMEMAQHIVHQLPHKVHLSFDIDALDPKFCPDTGTPVPGGLDIYEVYLLLQQLKIAKKEIIGIDFVEIGYNKNSTWNANVASRILYKLASFYLSI